MWVVSFFCCNERAKESIYIQNRTCPVFEAVGVEGSKGTSLSGGYVEVDITLSGSFPHIQLEKVCCLSLQAHQQALRQNTGD